MPIFTNIKVLYLFLSLSLSVLAHFCSRQKEEVWPKEGIVIRTVDSFGNPISATLVYEFRDCEYDFLAPDRVATNQQGVAVLKVEGDYVQFYADGFVSESYHCFGPANRPTTITIFAAPIPTYIRTKPFSEITYFRNTSGHCAYEEVVGTTVKADANGHATIYFSPHDVYKIQVGEDARCFQPDQDVHRLVF